MVARPSGTRRRVVRDGQRAIIGRVELVKDDRRIAVGFKVVQGVVGDVWGTGIAHNGRALFRAFLATHGDEGSFAVRVWTRKTDGPDFFRVRARNLTTDEICRGRAVI